MKLLNLDIGLQARQELTHGLRYTGDMIGAIDGFGCTNRSC